MMCKPKFLELAAVGAYCEGFSLSSCGWRYATAAFLHHDLFKKAKRLAERSQGEVIDISPVHLSIRDLHSCQHFSAFTLRTHLGRSLDAFRVDEQISLLWSFAIVSLPSDTLCSSPCLKVGHTLHLFESLCVSGREHQKPITAFQVAIFWIPDPLKI